MPNRPNPFTLDRIGLLALITTGMAGGAAAQEVSLNYDRLSSLEEPLAVEVGDITLFLTGLLDAPITLDLDDDEGQDFADIGFIGNFQVNAETQLANRWTIGVAYFGQYETGAFADDDAYTDNVAAFIGGSWGTLVGGNVSDLVREETRRDRGVGNGFLAFDNFYGELSDYGGGYAGRFGPTRLSTVIDEDGNFEVGAMFQRPIGNKDYRFTARYADGETLAADGVTVVSSQGVGGVGAVTYGSSIFDVGVGYESLSTSDFDADRWFASAGARRKIGGLTLSAEAHYGEVDGQSEISLAIGAAYDIARGLSLDLGVNYQDAEISIGDTLLVDTTDETEAIFSLRYSY